MPDLLRRNDAPMLHPDSQATPPRWRMVKERVWKEDGRYLIYYRFLPAEETPPPRPADETGVPAANPMPTQEKK